jgi:protein TonB
MFSNLIESGSHAADLKRKGRFFLGTTALYLLLLAATGVGSIYAYNARLEEPGEYELLSMMRFAPADSGEPQRRQEQRPAASQSRANQVATRTELSYQTPYRGERVASATARDINPNVPVVINGFNSDPPDAGGLVVGPNSGPGGNDRGGPVVGEPAEAPPPAIRATPQPVPAPAPQRPTGPIPVSPGVLVGKAVSKPAPPYPAIARAAHVQGPVAVQVVIDEQGRVISARATSGHPLLQQAAAQAAYQARFTPTLLGGMPVKVTGIITYNFVLNQ